MIAVWGIPDWLALFIGMVGYVAGGAAICLLVIFASLKIEARVRAGRAALALPGPEKASAQERRAAEDLGYTVEHWWGQGR